MGGGAAGSGVRRRRAIGALRQYRGVDRVDARDDAAHRRFEHADARAGTKTDPERERDEGNEHGSLARRQVANDALAGALAIRPNIVCRYCQNM